MSMLDFIQESIEISLEEQKIKLSKEAIEQLAGDVDGAVDCYNETGRGPVENPLIYQMKEQEVGHEKNIESIEKDYRNRLSEKDDIIHSLRRKIWSLEDELEKR